jgi:MFS family permease
VWGGIGGLGSVVGLVAAGALTDLLSWRLVFGLNLPLALLAIAFIPLLVVETTGAAAPWTFPARCWSLADWWRSSPGCSAGRPAVDARRRRTPGRGSAPACLLRRPRVAYGQPARPARFLADRHRSTANLATAPLMCAMAAMFLLLTLYLQTTLGYSALQAGLAYLPFSAMFMGGLAVATRLIPRVGAGPVVVTAFLAAASGVLLISRMPVHGQDAGDVLPGMLLLASALGLGMPALQNAALHHVTEADAGLASGVHTTVQQLGSALGLAMLVTLALRAGSLAGYRSAFHVAAAILLIGAALTLLGLRQHRPDRRGPPRSRRRATSRRSGTTSDHHLADTAMIQGAAPWVNRHA